LGNDFNDMPLPAAGFTITLALLFNLFFSLLNNVYFNIEDTELNFKYK